MLERLEIGYVLVPLGGGFEVARKIGKAAIDKILPHEMSFKDETEANEAAAARRRAAAGYGVVVPLEMMREQSGEHKSEKVWTATPTVLADSIQMMTEHDWPASRKDRIEAFMDDLGLDAPEREHFKRGAAAREFLEGQVIDVHAPNFADR